MVVERFRAVGPDKERYRSPQIHQLVERLHDNLRQQPRRSAGDRIAAGRVAQRRRVFPLLGCVRIGHSQRQIGLTRQIDAVETPLIKRSSRKVGRDAKRGIGYAHSILQHRLHGYLRLRDGMDLLDRHVVHLLHDARRPFDADGVDVRRLAQTEIWTEIVLRKIAAGDFAQLPHCFAS